MKAYTNERSQSISSRDILTYQYEQQNNTQTFYPKISDTDILSESAAKKLSKAKKTKKCFFAVRTCGLPQIEPDLMYNMTVNIHHQYDDHPNDHDQNQVKPGERVVFNCKVDLSCMVSTIRWYHELENGTEVNIIEYQ